MVSLAVGVTNSPHVQRTIAQGPSLRDAALWYPAAPDPGCCLNDKSFTGESLSAAGYQPLFWTRFGGPKGIYLRHLSGVSVNFLGKLRGIDFHYDTDEVPAEVRHLGRYNYIKLSRVNKFHINGAGGEHIKIVEASVKCRTGPRLSGSDQPGKLMSFKVNLVCSDLRLSQTPDCGC